MFDNARDLELIEQAERDTPFCWCGSQTVPVGRPDGGVWLACASRTQPKGVLRKLLTLDFAVTHTDLPILEPADFQRAA